MPEQEWRRGRPPARRYIAASDKLLPSGWRRTADKLFARHVAQRQALYARAVNAADYSTALRVAKDEAELQGLYPPKKIAPTNPDGDREYGLGFTDDERAAIARRRRRAIRAAGLVPDAGGPVPADGSLLPGPGGADEGRPAPAGPVADETLGLDGEEDPGLVLPPERQEPDGGRPGPLTAILEPPALVLIVARAQRQAAELLAQVKLLYALLNRKATAPPPWAPKPVKQLEADDERRGLTPHEALTQDSASSMEMANGSRIITLPGKTARSSATPPPACIVIDEASRVPDTLYYAVRPMLAVSGRPLVCLSTPFGKRGWFFEAWEGRGKAKDTWRRVEVRRGTAHASRPSSWQRREAEMGPRWYRQEYLCSFEDTVDAVFAHEDIQAALSDDVKPLFGGE